MKRLAIAGAVGALLCAPTHPAGAQNPTVTAKVVGVSNRQIVSGTIAVVGKGSSPAGVDEVSIDVDNLVTAKEKPSGLTQEADVRYEWNTAIVTGSSQIASNGEYVVRVRATDKAGSTDSASVTILVDNAPSIPSGVSAFVDGATVKVTWATNAEPDIVGYVVERDSGVGFVAVAQTTEPAFAEALDPGSYSYRVTALRKSPSAEGVHASAASAVVTAVVSAPKSSSSGSGGRGPGSKDERPLDVVRHKFSERGLPSGIAISGSAGLPHLPSSAPLPWGDYETKLPYKLPKGGVPLDAAPANIAARSPWRVIPPDGLRWVAAGLLLVVTSGLLRFAATRLIVG